PPPTATTTITHRSRCLPIGRAPMHRPGLPKRGQEPVLPEPNEPSRRNCWRSTNSELLRHNGILAIITAAEWLVRIHVDVCLDEMLRPVGEHEVGASGMTRLETKGDAPVIGGPCSIVFGVHGLPVLVQMTIRIGRDLVVDRDDCAVEVV